MKKRESCAVESQVFLTEDICSMWICTPDLAAAARAGQFVTLYSKDQSRMLPRPLSICEIDREGGRIRLVYRIAGNGTLEFSNMRAGDRIEVMGPLGNGFPLEEARGKRVLLMGGGIGIPPMVETAKQLDGNVTVTAGYREVLFLTEELAAHAELYLATEDGSAGTRGTVLDAVRENGITADVIFACGPKPMLRAVKAYAEENGIPCWISMEERMACGIGACLACTCRSAEIDEHSQVRNKRVCRDGPVFSASEVLL